MKNKIAIIAARGGSKRLPGKNILDFNGKPMIEWPISAAQLSGEFEEIIVSSDDDQILAIAESAGAIPRWRHPDIADDKTDVHQVWDAVIRSLDAKKCAPRFFCGIYPTAVFLDVDEICGSYAQMILALADSCIGVSKFEYHPWQWLSQKPTGWIGLEFPEEIELPSYPPAYASNGTLQWFRTDSFMANPTPYPEKLIGYVTESVDINTEDDYRRALDKAKNKI